MFLTLSNDDSFTLFQELCVSSVCIVLSANIIQGLDETQDPCENFYEFASTYLMTCFLFTIYITPISDGGWIEKHAIPSGKSRFGSFDALSEDNKRVIRKILDPPSTEKALADPDDEETLRKLRDLFSGCMNEDLLNDRGQEPLLTEVNEIRTLFRSDEWKKMNVKRDPTKPQGPSKHGLTAAIAYMHSRGCFRRAFLRRKLITMIGLGGLFSFDIDGDVGSDPNFMTLWFFQPDLGLPAKVRLLMVLHNNVSDAW